MVNTDLRGADLSHAVLSDALLLQADLRYATLSSADLFGANLTDADLSGANLLLANMDTNHRIMLDTSGANPRSKAAVQAQLGMENPPNKAELIRVPDVSLQKG